MGSSILSKIPDEIKRKVELTYFIRFEDLIWGLAISNRAIEDLIKDIPSLKEILVEYYENVIKVKSINSKTKVT